MADDPDGRVRIAAFHALACDRCKGDTCAPGPDRVLEPALRHLTSDPDPHVRSMAADSLASSPTPMPAPSPPWGHPTPRTRARPSERRRAGTYPAGPPTNGPPHPLPSNGTALRARAWLPVRR
ncbi:HEAT repeat domain-containing protein [Streptomyces sp. N2A]|uniref:HEAT repeat domain-containing protein n=1 Tax=Streptomyces sp. N2A TaxID=3073936 RepID=UPI0037DA2A5D